LSVKLSRLVQPEALREIIEEFNNTRRNTMDIFKPIQAEDAVIQANDFGSPPNWHIAHVTWFFHQILNKYGKGKNVRRSNENENENENEVNLSYLNSYYQKFGEILPKSERGKYPRPNIQDTIKYRSIIDQEVNLFLNETLQSNDARTEGLSEDIMYDVRLGNQHEMQHQELMIYDLQYYYQRFSDPEDNYKPIKKSGVEGQKSRKAVAIKQKIDSIVPSSGRYKGLEECDSNDSEGITVSCEANYKGSSSVFEVEKPKPTEMVTINGGLYDVGFSGKGFCYDNELPEHQVYLNSYKIDRYPVTNGDYASFIEEGGYSNYRFWLADGWELVQNMNWNSPLYWQRDANSSGWIKKDFRGINKLNPREPVMNLSYYEADAYAKWNKKRLPTEAEWEKAASWRDDLQKKAVFPWGDEKLTPAHANVMESYLWGPSEIGSHPLGKSYYGCHQMIGDVWEWTSSEYVLYPGFESKFPEYTDKWAINQKVLRGGCFATPSRQIRNSYRNYFRPQERILFSGFRCAKDL
jgi:formylglycine-generating enzyme required for sulfatase activity